ncbi:hypothetical protein ACFFUB_08845 [Algimonas porphyrae]|uniref:Lipoprotein n=1 Tax=Algimonas porphyrae TaxID=1128113 RepID=A0ABQ5V465_9PROT|nr:hypothetical protein [Algimonas porphyrae]GLQ21880.1 hypothetical protein GCM10007854_28350 [Algimonas porphyrae]
MKKLVAGFLGLFLISACMDASGGDVEGGGLTPPPGFFERVDENCRAEATITLSEDAPSVRQLNGQSLLTYQLTDRGTMQCAVRHSDESVIDIRVMGAE